MTTSKASKRRRRESSIHSSSDSTEQESISDGEEYYHKSKGKQKLREVNIQDQKDVERKVEYSLVNEEKAVQACGICLTEEEVGRGKLDCCDHYFCFGCIMEWSKVESRCPICKQRFVTIVKLPVPGMSRSRPRTFHIPHKNQVYEPSEEEIRLFTDPYLHVVCTECQQAGDERLLLLCDGCDAAAHTYCVGLGRKVPRGDWFCNTCSIQVQGFQNDDHDEVYNESQEHDDGFNDLQDEEHDEDHSSHMLNVVVEEQPIQRGRPRRRAAASRLNQDGRRHTRLHPAPTLSQEARAAIPIQEPSGSSPLSSGSESTPASARTLSSQRIIRQRVNDIRNNWDQLRRGEVQFGSISRSASRTLASQAGRNQSAEPSNDISQAWAMMEHARALRGDRVAPNPAPTTRALEHDDITHGGKNVSREGNAVHSPRFSQVREQIVRTESARHSHQVVENRPRIQWNQSQQQNPRREIASEASGLIENRLSNQTDIIIRRDDVRGGNHLVESTPRGHREDGREGSLAVGGRSSDHRGGRISGRRDISSVHGIQENNVRDLRTFIDNNDRDREKGSMPGSSGENEGHRVVDRSGRRSHVEDQQTPRLRARGSSGERRELKEQLAHYVKTELKPLYRLGHIDKRQHIRIARLATQELLAAFGIEHRGPETRAFGSLDRKSVV